MNIEDEYSPKAAQDAARRQSQSNATNRQIEQRNLIKAQRISRELSEAQKRARQPIDDETALAQALIQLGSVLGVQPKIERKRKAR